MEIPTTLSLAIAFGALASPVVGLVIDFDTDSKWTAGSGAIHSYQTDHTYVDQGWTFTGGPALRQTTNVQDGVPGAFGVRSWRLQDRSTTDWRGSFSGSGSITNVDFGVRRWDGTDPGIFFGVSYSVDNGSSFTSVGTIDNSFLGNSSNWTTFSFNVVGASATSIDPSDNVIVKVASLRGTERIMIDNFSFTTAAVPESGATLTFLGLTAFGLILFRRFQK